MMMELLLQDEADSAADQDQLADVPRWGRSRVGNTKNKNHHRLAGALLFDSYYFAEDAANTPKKFWYSFRMNKQTFMKIVFGVREYDNKFMWKPDYTGLYGFSSVHKCTAALWCIVYGAPCDTNEYYLHMAKSTCFETVGRFFWAVVAVFGKDYFRAPTEHDTARILV
jgi:hypothetical protein